MDKIAEFIRDPISVFVVACFGLLVPGTLTITLFKLELFFQLDILKLLYLSFVISAPSLGAFFVLMLAADKIENPTDVQAYICVASIFNLITFCIGLLVKLFYPALNKLQFVLIILFVFSACLLATAVETLGKRKKK